MEEINKQMRTNALLNSHDNLKKMWSDELQGSLKKDFETAVHNRLFNLDYWKIDKNNTRLAEVILDNPLATFGILQQAIHAETGNGGFPVNLKFNGNSLVGINISKLRTKHVNKLTSIEAFVIESNSPRPRLTQAAYICKKCGASTYVDQPMDIDARVEPFVCSNDECKSVNFDFKMNLSTYQDFQQIVVQNPFHDKQQVELEVHLYDDKVGTIVPGEWVQLNGVYLLKNQQKQAPDPYYFVFGTEQSSYHILEFTDEELIKAKELAKSDELWSILLKSFAPSVFGYNIEKKSLLIQLVGGVWHDLPDGTCRRGSIHNLLVGDPGTAKSTLSEASKSIAPRLSYATGKGATSAGLTAGGDRSKITGHWKLRAGALVLANGGICFLDEFDKIPEEVQGSLHGPMEKGVVEASKIAMVNQRLPARTSILGIMNPRDGRFNDNEYSPDSMSITDITQLDSAMLSRFDNILFFKDKPDIDIDRAIGKHMHYALQKNNKNNYLSIDFLRKYIYYSSQIKPTISDEIDDILTEYYVDLRHQISTDILHVTPRHKDVLRRFSEASAKIRFSNIVEEKDVSLAKYVLHDSLISMNIKDLDAISTGWTLKQKKRYSDLIAVLPVSLNSLLMHGFSEDELQIFIEKGKIFEKNGLYYRRDK